MIWGCLWDRTLIWLTDTYAASDGEYGKSYDEIVDSSRWGNYSTNSINETGSSENYKANNIYDLAGNVAEWTIEACSSTHRVARGGGCNTNGSNYPVGNRDCYYPSTSTLYRGSRVALYIEP